MFSTPAVDNRDNNGYFMTRARIRVLVTSLPLLTCLFKLVNNQEKFIVRISAMSEVQIKSMTPEEIKRKYNLQ